MPFSHGHSGLPILFNRCKYARIFPWPVIIVVTLGLRFRFTASLLSTLGKNSLCHNPRIAHRGICTLSDITDRTTGSAKSGTKVFV
jgi:hypothetical protein